MEAIIAGVRKFKNEVFPQKKELYAQLAGGQNPKALMITCADSRIDMELVTQSEPGQLFFFRNAGNIVPPYGTVLGAMTATIEYALEALNIPDIVLCGHSDCGAMKGLLNPDLVATMPTVAEWLRFADVARAIVDDAQDLSPEARLERVIKENILAQLEHLRTHPSVAARLARGELRLHGWVYDIRDGHIDAYDRERGRFVSLESTPMPHATPPRRKLDQR